MGQAVLDDSENRGDDSGYAQDLQDEVLEDFADHVANRANLSLQAFVFSISEQIYVNLDNQQNKQQGDGDSIILQNYY